MSLTSDGVLNRAVEIWGVLSAPSNPSDSNTVTFTLLNTKHNVSPQHWLVTILPKQPAARHNLERPMRKQISQDFHQFQNFHDSELESWSSSSSSSSIVLVLVVRVREKDIAFSVLLRVCGGGEMCWCRSQTLPGATRPHNLQLLWLADRPGTGSYTPTLGRFSVGITRTPHYIWRTRGKLNISKHFQNGKFPRNDWNAISWQFSRPKCPMVRSTDGISG